MGKKLLFIYYQNIKAGGVAKVLANLANELVSDGYQIDILFLMREHEDFYPLDSRIKKHYVDSFSFWTFKICKFNQKYLRFIPKIANINTYIYQLGVAKLMNRWLKENHMRYDNIISCWYKLSCSLALNKIVNHKTIAWEHISHTTGGPFWNRLRRFYKNLKAIISTNVPGERYYRTVNEQSTTIYNMMDSEVESQAFISPENKKNIISVVARLDPEKNISEFINIISGTDLPENWKVVIIGSGSQEDHLKKEVVEKGLYSKIELLGSKTMEEVYELLRSSKINCLTSRVEALPTILIQSMFFSNVLVAYDCNYGPSDIINSNNGFLIDLGDQQAFIGNLEKLIHDEQLLNELMRTSFEESQNWRKESIKEKWKSILS
ncbi:glycosyltransferase [Epilithonimonas sp.]|uniref:glycosyltransferase n=1 Tax=Epilithonimonas sp. TaxID=2894511 RepID=UPI0028A1403D|nr:glycosyltransferase [Epilithonimonas sp.]